MENNKIDENLLSYITSMHNVHAATKEYAIEKIREGVVDGGFICVLRNLLKAIETKDKRIDEQFKKINELTNTISLTDNYCRGIKEKEIVLKNDRERLIIKIEVLKELLKEKI